MVVGHEGVWVLSGFGQVGGREREAFAGENSSFFPACARPGKEEEAQCRLKRYHFVLLFFF